MDYQIRVEVSVYGPPGQGNLRLSEDVTTPNCTFEDMANILHGFHELAISIKQAREKTNGNRV
jgi:hypothetical protein